MVLSPGVQELCFGHLLPLARKVTEKNSPPPGVFSRCVVYVCGIMRSLPSELPGTWLQGADFSLFTLQFLLLLHCTMHVEVYFSFLHSFNHS